MTSATERRRLERGAPSAFTAAAVLLLAACSGGAAAPVEATTAPSLAGTASSASTATPSELPDTTRIMDDLRYLAVTVGSRPAGSTNEERAAHYIADELAAAGYTVEIQDFTFDTQVDESQVAIPDGIRMTAYAMDGSPNASVSAPIVFGGRGRSEDIDGTDLTGRIVVFDRGTVMFNDMAREAEQRGAVAVVVVNNEEGPFRGTLGDETSTIPVVSVERRHRETLLAAVGSVEVTTDYGMRTTMSQNVVARAGAECTGYLGAHYDTVQQGPGANDNGSGTALIMEVARVNRREGLCLIAFGSEELGLFGSQAYVDEHLSGIPKFMLNVDMAGRFDGPIIVGNEDLTNAILNAITAAGLDSSLRRGAFPPFASSDHVSFEAVGVPAVTFNSGDDEFIHTAEDTIDRIDPDAIAMFAAAVDAALDALLPDTGAAPSR